MADLGFSGRVLAGEDSEEDEEEEELDFQFGAFGGPRPPPPVVTQPTLQPKFTVQAPVVSHEEDETDEENEDEAPSVAVHAEEKHADEDEEIDAARPGRVSIDSSAKSISRPSTPELPSMQSASASEDVAKDDAYWTLPESATGPAIMGNAIVQKLQPSLDATIRRISELTESQQRLLTLLSTQHKAVCSNDQIENVAIVMGKLPQYIKRVHDMKAAINDINASVDRMKKRSESLRVDAQSYAIKKENKRESLMQWNKLYAAKSFEGATMSASISSTMPPPTFTSAPSSQPPSGEM